MKISVTFEDTDIHKLLEGIISHPNKKELVKLLTPLLCDYSKAAEWFLKVSMGKKLPEVLVPGTLCYINIRYLGYDANKDAIRNSDLANENEEVICKVKEFRGFHNYAEYSIEFTNIDENGVRKKAYTNTDPTNLTVIEEF